MKKLVRITTVPVSLDKLLSGQLAYMGAHYEVIAVSSGGDQLEKVAQRENARSFPLEMTRRITPFKDLLATYRLYRFLKKEKPLIVHSHTPKAGIVGMMAAYFAGIPYRLHTVAGLPLLETTGRKRKLLEQVEAATYRFATNVYPNSFELKRIIASLRLCPERKLAVLGNGSSNGIDVRHFDRKHFDTTQLSTVRERYGIDPSDFVFVFVGRLVGDKGINELVAAFDAFRLRHPHARLLLVGPFEDELDPLSSRTKDRIGKGEGIVATGFVNDVRPLLCISDVLVFPSYREGFPNVVMQAGALELPCIVTDINGCNEIIADGHNGIVIPAKDEARLYDAMQLLATDSRLYADLKANARNAIVSRYDNQLIWNAILREYERLAENI